MIWSGRHKPGETNWQADNMAGVGPAAVDKKANTMRVLVNGNGPNRHEGTAAAAQGSGRMFLTLSFSILGVAVAYFGALYLIAR